MLQNGKHHSDEIGYFVVRESEGTAELEIQDAPAMFTRQDAEQWIEQHGIPGVDYWICAPVNTMSLVVR